MRDDMLALSEIWALGTAIVADEMERAGATPDELQVVLHAMDQDASLTYLAGADLRTRARTALDETRDLEAGR